MLRTKLVHLIFIFFILMLLSECTSRSQKSVTVMDDFGIPVQGARVVVQAMSFEGFPTFTTADGIATVDAGIVGAKQVAVSKQGYQSEWAQLPATWPLKIILKKEKSAL